MAADAIDGAPDAFEVAGQERALAEAWRLHNVNEKRVEAISENTYPSSGLPYFCHRDLLGIVVG